MLSLSARADWIAHLLKATTQQHHRPLQSVFRPYVPDDAAVFDVGAHAGQFSKLFAGLAPRGRVFAFEPSAYARSVLAPALKWNRIRNVEIVPMGLSDADGTAVLHTPVKRHGGLGFGAAHLGDRRGPRAVVDQTVTLTTLDGFFRRRKLTRLDFVKADVEGWEAHLLRGAAATLAAHRPALYLEVDAAHLARAGASPPEIWDRLTPLGYRTLKGPGFEATAGFDGDGNYLFVR
jgi:FkbM family methyltransferase